MGYFDFATNYWVDLSPLPAFRDVEPEEYRRMVAELIAEIEQEGKRKRERDDDTVAGVEKILSQNPYEAPTRRPKQEYRHASDALQSGTMEAIHWFPEGCFRPQLPFLGTPAPARPPSPPTRPIEIEESEERVERVVAAGW